MNKYDVVYEIHNGEWPDPIRQEKTVEAVSVEQAIKAVEHICYLNYMCCEIISIIRK